jgi:hypothetical protein
MILDQIIKDLWSFSNLFIWLFTELYKLVDVETLFLKDQSENERGLR